MGGVLAVWLLINGAADAAASAVQATSTTAPRLGAEIYEIAATFFTKCGTLMWLWRLEELQHHARNSSSA